MSGVGVFRSLSILVISLTILLVGCGDNRNPDGWVDNGPDLSSLVLTQLDGSEKRLDSYAGKTLIINFWATWCGPCREEMPALQRLSEQLDPAHYVVIGVSVDTGVERVRAFLQDQGVGFKQFIDADMELAMSSLQIRAFPETFIVTPRGQVQRRILGARAWDDKKYYQSVLAL